MEASVVRMAAVSLESVECTESMPEAEMPKTTKRVTDAEAVAHLAARFKKAGITASGALSKEIVAMTHMVAKTEVAKFARRRRKRPLRPQPG
jgi:hypothetical protein